MNDSLDFSTEAFESLLNHTKSMVLRQFETLDSQKGYHDHSQSEVEGWFKEPLPEKGMDVSELLEFVEEKVLDTATGNLGPHMYAYVMSGGNQVAILAEKLATTINQNQTKWHLAPAMNEIEKRVVAWTAELLGFPQDSGGVLVSGGSAANLTGLTVGRNIHFEKSGIRKTGLFGQKPFVVYASQAVHSCVEKSVELLGIGSDYLRKIPTNAGYQIDLGILEKQIQIDRANGLHPFCSIGPAGTVNPGAIDELDA